MEQALTRELSDEEGAHEHSTDSPQTELLEEAITHMAQGLMVYGAETFEFFSDKAIELMELPPSLVKRGSRWEDYFQYLFERGDYGEGEAARRKLESVKTDIREGRPHRVERKTPSGRIVLLQGVPRKGGGFITTVADVTENRHYQNDLVAARAAAEAAERAKSEFLANMSHEIRTPMNGVMGMAELLAGTQLDAKQRMFTDVIVKSSAALLSIINDILDFSKIEAGRLELVPAPFALREAIEDVATLMAARAAEKQLELVVRVDPALPQSLIGDVGRIRQIVTNLVGNAVKFTDAGHVYLNVGGQVANVTGTGSIARLSVRVEDTGIGIPKDQLARVFDKFSQIDTSATRRHQGTGLGLSICASLVHLMGGTIEVDSESGKGTVFSFAIDLPVQGEAAPVRPIQTDVTGARVVVIDDNAVNRAILSEQMAAWRFDAATCHSGKEGLALMRAIAGAGRPAEAVILDYQMPDMSGAEVLREIRNDPALALTPVILLTSVDQGQASPELIALGLQASLTKPARSSQLLAAIQQAIAERRRSNAAASSGKSDAAMPAHEEPRCSDNTPQAESNVAQRSPELQAEILDILVAEDNEVNQILMRQILEGTKYTFHIVENGRLAVSSHKTHNPRIILMDLSMPEMNGLDAAKAIRDLERATGQRSFIVGVTAHALKGDMEICLEAGMDDYLPKPISPSHMLQKLDGWMTTLVADRA